MENLNRGGVPRSSGEYAEAYLSAKSNLENQRNELLGKMKNPDDVMKETYSKLLTAVNNDLIRLDIEHQVGDVPRKTIN